MKGVQPEYAPWYLLLSMYSSWDSQPTAGDRQPLSIHHLINLVDKSQLTTHKSNESKHTFIIV